jgi:hypothetical protein
LEFIKKKTGTYLLVKLSKADKKYLKDFKNYEHRKPIFLIPAEW